MPRYEHDEEKRRQRREAAQRKREAEARRVRKRLVLTLFALVVCGLVIYNLTEEVRSVLPEPVVKETQAAVETTKATRPVEKDPITTIHIKAAGDLNVTDNVVNSGVSVGGFDYSKVFKDVGAILSDADLTVMNFEGNLYGEPYGSASTSAPIELMQALRNYGVDLIQMANSCAINNGLNGLNATLNAIRSVGMEPVGAYANEEELKLSKGYTMTEIQGVKVAFVAFTKGLGGRGMPAGSENLVNLLYEDYATEYKVVNKTRIETILKDVQTEKPDIIIALLHWGSEYSEYNKESSGSQASIISQLQKLGVDVILGTHPHVVQPIVYDADKGTLVCYSLGDFFGDADRGATNYSIILDIEITKDANAGTTKVTGYSYQPIYTVRSGESIGNNDWKVVRIEKALEAHQENFLDKINDTCETAMIKALNRIDERVEMPTEPKK